VYRAESSQQMQFAFSAPVRAPDGTWLGMLIGALPVDSAIGKLNLRGPAESGRIVAVLGPRDNDRDRTNQALPSDLCFVVHPKLERGREVYLRGTGAGAPARELAKAGTPGEQFGLRWVEPQLIADYRDPVAGGDQQWLAAFAPVGQTGYVVVVQTTRDAVLAQNRSLSRKLFINAGIPLALGVALLALLARLPVQRRKNLFYFSSKQ
jgi:serine/threonine-protein kinase